MYICFDISLLRLLEALAEQAFVPLAQNVPLEAFVSLAQNVPLVPGMCRSAVRYLFAKLLYMKVSTLEIIIFCPIIVLNAADKDEAKGSGWERFEFDKDAPLDDEEIEGQLYFSPLCLLG